MAEVKPMSRKEVEEITNGARHYAPEVQEKLWRAKMEIIRLQNTLQNVPQVAKKAPQTEETTRANDAEADIDTIIEALEALGTLECCDSCKKANEGKIATILEMAQKMKE